MCIPYSIQLTREEQTGESSSSAANAPTNSFTQQTEGDVESLRYALYSSSIPEFLRDDRINNYIAPGPPQPTEFELEFQELARSTMHICYSHPPLSSSMSLKTLATHYAPKASRFIELFTPIPVKVANISALVSKVEKDSLKLFPSASSELPAMTETSSSILREGGVQLLAASPTRDSNISESSESSENLTGSTDITTPPFPIPASPANLQEPPTPETIPSSSYPINSQNYIPPTEPFPDNWIGILPVANMQPPVPISTLTTAERNSIIEMATPQPNERLQRALVMAGSHRRTTRQARALMAWYHFDSITPGDQSWRNSWHSKGVQTRYDINKFQAPEPTTDSRPAWLIRRQSSRRRGARSSLQTTTETTSIREEIMASVRAVAQFART
jgi:hypothetical protein